MTQEKLPENPPQTLWQKGFDVLKMVYPQVLYISFLTFILPQIIWELAFAQTASQLVEISKNFSGSAGPKDFYQLFLPASEYAMIVVFSAILLLAIHLSGYFGIVKMCLNASSGRAPLQTLEAFLGGFRQVFTRGIVSVILFFILFVIIQAIFPLAVLALLPGIMIPVLIVSGEQPGFVRPIIHALRLSYGEGYPGGRWPLFFQLMSLGAFFYAGVLLTTFLCNQLLTLDTVLNLPRYLWNQTIPGLPMGPMYFLTFILKLTIVSTIVTFLGALTATVYVWVKRLPPQGLMT